MGRHYRFVGVVKIPEGTVIPEKELPFMTSRSHARFTGSKGNLECYYISAPGGTCDIEPEETVEAVIEHMKKLGAEYVIGKIVWDGEDECVYKKEVRKERKTIKTDA